MKFHYRILTTSLFLSFVFVFQINSLLAQDTGSPTSVPLDLAKFAAMHYAKQFYGEMEFYSSVTYYDPETEHPSVYAIILKTPGSERPSLANLEQEIASGQAKIRDLEAQFIEIDKLDLSGKKKADKLAKLRSEIRTVREEMAGSHRFATFLCGATEEHVPVIRAHRGLPEHMLKKPLVKALQENEPELQGKALGRILYLGMFDQAYVFQEQGTGNRTQKVDAGSQSVSTGFAVFFRGLKLEKISDIKSEIASRRAKEQETSTQIRESEDQTTMAQRKEERRQTIANKWGIIKNVFAKEGEK